MIKYFIFLILFTLQTLYAQTTLSWYAWNSFTTYKQNYYNFFTTLPKTNRIFLSLNPQEIKALKYSEYEADKLKTFLEMAHKKDIKVEVLIGDPNYIYLENFSKLLHLVYFYQHFHFDGLQLDIESSGLPKEQKYIWEQNITDVIKKLYDKTSFSIGLSINHKDLTPTLIKKLSHNGLKEIVVMYYSTNEEKLVDTLSHLLSSYPNIYFSLAVSVEPIPIVNKEETFRTLGKIKALQEYEKISKALKKNNNYLDLVIQSYKYFMEMP